MEEFNMLSEVDCGKLNLAHVARNQRTIKKKTKTNKRQCPVPTYFGIG